MPKDVPEPEGDGDPGNEGGEGGNEGSTPNCGNGVLDDGEQCDTNDLAGQDCATLGYSGGGMLMCDPVMCTFDASDCVVGDPGGTWGD